MSITRARQPRGTSIGGQFATQSKSESAVSLAGLTSEPQRYGPDITIDGVTIIRIEARAGQRSDDYTMSHTAPHPNHGAEAISAIADTFPTDAGGHFLEHPDWYGGEHDETIAQLRSLYSAGGQPDPNAMITVYRAVPRGVDVINDGDWVATSEEYAIDHALGLDEATILRMDVPARELYTDGNSLEEWGWSPSV